MCFEVVRAWARFADRHLLQIFLLKLLFGSLLFIGLLRVIIGDFGRDCRKLEEVEHLLEECSLRRLQLERQEGRREKAKKYKYKYKYKYKKVGERNQRMEVGSCIN